MPPGLSDTPPASLEAPEDRENAIEGVWSHCGVPKRYRGVQAASKPVGWAYICGQFGTGKTYGACSMLRRYLEDSTYRVAPGLYSTPRVRFTTASHYLAAVKRAFDDPNDYEARAARNCDCLVLDDLGQEVPTAWAVEQLYDLINDRYNDEHITIVTSNFGLSEIAARLAENGGEQHAGAIASRLMGCCTPYRLTGADRRLSHE